MAWSIGKKRFCALVIALGTNAAFAHTITQSLANKARATDLYQVSCFDDGNGAPAYLVAEVRDMAPIAAPLINLQTFRGNVATNATDAVDGDAGYSRKITNNGGASGAGGVFTLIVNKTGPGIERYQVEVHCMASSGDHTGTEDSQLQDQ